MEFVYPVEVAGFRAEFKRFVDSAATPEPVDEGVTAFDGELPANPSGGVLSPNPIGASDMIRAAGAAGPLSVRKVKRSVLETEFLPEKEALDIESRIGAEVYASEDAREGPKAFKRKRAPQFKGC